MTIVNLTPYAIILRPIQGDDIVILSSGVARVAEVPGVCMGSLGIIDDLGDDRAIPVYGPPTYGTVFKLPPPQPETVYIVSAIVASALAGSGRTDVVMPGTGPQDGAVRYPAGHPQAGQIKAVTRLVRAPL